MRALLAALAIGALSIDVAGIGVAQAQSSPDKALQGTWDGIGQVATSAMAKTGTFTLHIDPSGLYLQVFHGPRDFVVDWGSLYADKGEYWRKTMTGLEDRGGYARQGDGFRFTGAWSRFLLTPATAAKTAQFQRLADTMKTRPAPTVDAWSARATTLAALWQADAVLDRVTLDDPAADGSIGPRSSLALTFASPGAGRSLVLRPAPAGGFDSAVLAPGAPKSP